MLPTVDKGFSDGWKLTQHFRGWRQIQCGLSRLHAAFVGAHASMLAIQDECVD